MPTQILTKTSVVTTVSVLALTLVSMAALNFAAGYVLGGKKEQPRQIVANQSVKLSKDIIVPASESQSIFFKDDLTAQSIVAGTDYQMRDESYFTPQGEIDTLSFEYKVINALRQIGNVFNGSVFRFFLCYAP